MHLISLTTPLPFTYCVQEMHIPVPDAQHLFGHEKGIGGRGPLLSFQLLMSHCPQAGSSQNECCHLGGTWLASTFFPLMSWKSVSGLRKATFLRGWDTNPLPNPQPGGLGITICLAFHQKLTQHHWTHQGWGGGGGGLLLDSSAEWHPWDCGHFLRRSFGPINKSGTTHSNIPSQC